MDRSAATDIGDPRIAGLLRAFIGALEQTFPSRVRAVYLSGSYVADTPTPASDIDGLVIFRGPLRDDERDGFVDLARCLSRSSGIHLDLVPRGEEWFTVGEHPAKTASRLLIYG